MTEIVPRSIRTAAALLIGNELLSGKIADGNFQPLALMLRARGIRLVRASMVEDDRAQIVRELNRLRESVDLVVTSGGIGPTHDDVTIEAVADAFGVNTHVHPKLESLLRSVYKDALTEDHLRMALAPVGADLCAGQDGRWPNVVMGNVWMLPGIPELFRARLAILREYVIGEREFHSRSVQLRLEETDIKRALDRVVAAHPNVEVGSYPKWFDPSYKTKVTFDGASAEAVDAAVAALLAELPSDALVTDD